MKALESMMKNKQVLENWESFILRSLSCFHPG